MEEEPRRLRADAERNRRRLIEVATEMFGERGMEVGVAEIAQRAGVGRGTLFRNFPSKEALIAAVVVVALDDSTARAQALLELDDPADALFTLIDQAHERMLTDRALFEALDDEWMAHPEIQAAHHAMFGVVETLVSRAQAVGAVRHDVSAVDVVLMIKGVCESACAFQQVDADLTMRQLDLVKSALTTEAAAARPLRGRAPTVEDLERAKTLCTPVPSATEPVATSQPG
jgi:AcrR family transcriptional regulator